VTADSDDARRPLTGDEETLVAALLGHDFGGVEALRVQAGQVSASPGCTCGCGSLDLHVPGAAPRSSAPSPLPVEGTVVDAEGAPIGGLIVFLDGGMLAYLEVYSFVDHPLPLPLAERVRWEAGP
jgi:hypothetical protein